MDLGTFIPQELSNVIWAYGTMQYQQNPDFMQHAAQEMLIRGISQFEPQAISNVCWAFAKHDLIYDEFLEVPYSTHTCCHMPGGSFCMIVLRIQHVHCSMPFSQLAVLPDHVCAMLMSEQSAVCRVMLVLPIQRVDMYQQMADNTIHCKAQSKFFAGMVLHTLVVWTLDLTGLTCVLLH